MAELAQPLPGIAGVSDPSDLTADFNSGVQTPPAPAILSPAAPPVPTAAAQNPYTEALPYTPRPGGVSPSMADQLVRQGFKAADTLAAQNPEPERPGAWARSLVGGFATALAGAGNVGKAPAGAGFLYGAGKGMQGAQEALERKREFEAKQKQQQFQNKIWASEEERKADTAAYERGLRFAKTQQTLSTQNKEIQDEATADAKKHIDAQVAAGAKEVQGGMTWEEVRDMAKQHATQGTPQLVPTDPGYVAPDPQGMHWLVNQNIHQDGWRPLRDSNGDLIPTKNDKGEITGSQRQQTYNMMTWGGDRPVDKDFAADAKQYLGLNFSDGTQKDKDGNIIAADKIPAQQARGIEIQIQQKKMDEIQNDKLGEALGLSKDALKNVHEKANYRDAAAAWAKWSLQDGASPLESLSDMYDHSKEVGPDGKQTPEALQAKQEYDQIVNAFGADIVNKGIDEANKETQEKIKAAAQAAKDNPQIEGDASKHGQEYIASLPPGRRELVDAITKGHVDAISPRLLTGKQGEQLLAEAYQADPDLDTFAISNYKNLLKAFTVGPEAQQIKAINAALPHMADLYKALDRGIGTTTPGVSWLEQKFGNQAALDVKNLRTIASQELAGLYSKGAITDQEHQTFQNQIDKGWQSAAEMQGMLYSMALASKRKVNALENQWTTGVPSPHWGKPRERAVLDQDALGAMADIESRHGGGKGTQTATSSATSGTAAKHQQAQFSITAPDGKTPLVFPSQKALDQFKAAHGIQ